MRQLAVGARGSVGSIVPCRLQRRVERPGRLQRRGCPLFPRRRRLLLLLESPAAAGGWRGRRGKLGHAPRRPAGLVGEEDDVAVVEALAPARLVRRVGRRKGRGGRRGWWRWGWRRGRRRRGRRRGRRRRWRRRGRRGRRGGRWRRRWRRRRWRARAPFLVQEPPRRVIPGVCVCAVAVVQHARIEESVHVADSKPERGAGGNRIAFGLAQGCGGGGILCALIAASAVAVAPVVAVRSTVSVHGIICVAGVARHFPTLGHLVRRVVRRTSAAPFWRVAVDGVAARLVFGDTARAATQAATGVRVARGAASTESTGSDAA